MAYVQPSGTIQLFNGMNLDNRYMHTLYFPNVTTQTTFFDGLVSSGLSFTNQSYSRVNRNAVKIKINAEIVQKCTYMRFNNRGNKWYYAFIVGIEYINENTTLIAFEIDVMQTWFFQGGSLQDCFIVRQHVAPSDDVFTRYLEPEPCGSEIYTMDYLEDVDAQGQTMETPATIRDFSGYSLVINTSNQPNASYLMRDGVVNGTEFRVYDPSASAVNIITQMGNLLGSWDKNQQKADIVDLYMFPRYFAGVMVDDGSAYDADYQPHNFSQYYIKHPKKYDNYTPQNKKLFGYPFAFLYATTMDGDSAEYKWEYFEGDVTGNNDIVEFDVNANVTGGGTIECHPRSYNGIDHNYDSKISINDFPKCSWSYDAYQAFVAAGGQTKAYYQAQIVEQKGMNAKRQNFIQNAPKAVLEGGAAVTAGVLTVGASATAAPVGVGAVIGAAAAGGGIASAGHVTTMGLRQEQIEIETDEALHKVAFTFQDAMYAPNQVVSRATPNIAVGAGYLGFRFYHCHVRDDEMVKIDNFLTTYGYAINDIKTPQLHNRPHWNFLQTRDCVVLGDMPASSKMAISKIFDGGIFLWNYQDGNSGIGNFSRKNSNGQLLNR